MSQRMMLYPAAAHIIAMPWPITPAPMMEMCRVVLSGFVHGGMACCCVFWGGIGGGGLAKETYLSWIVEIKDFGFRADNSMMAVLCRRRSVPSSHL